MGGEAFEKCGVKHLVLSAGRKRDQDSGTGQLQPGEHLIYLDSSDRGGQIADLQSSSAFTYPLAPQSFRLCLSNTKRRSP